MDFKGWWYTKHREKCEPLTVRDMKAELEGQIDGNLNEHQRVFDKWREDFNTIRPHEALGMKTPSDVYIKSGRKYDPEDVLIVYGKGYKSRMVNDRDFCNYRGKRLFVGNPFAGYNVGVKENKDDIEIWFDDFLIGVLDKITGLIIYEKDSIKVQKAQ